MQEMQEMRVQSLGQEGTIEEEMATCSSILTWKIPWRKEQRVGYNWVTEHTCMHKRKILIGKGKYTVKVVNQPYL